VQVEIGSLSSSCGFPGTCEQDLRQNGSPYLGLLLVVAEHTRLFEDCATHDDDAAGVEFLNFANKAYAVERFSICSLQLERERSLRRSPYPEKFIFPPVLDTHPGSNTRRTPPLVYVVTMVMAFFAVAFCRGERELAEFLHTSQTMCIL